MKVLIMAGGLPSTVSDEYEGLPKPMVEIGERPVLWHIMKYYSVFGIKEFIVCAGYKSELIKEYFNNYYIYESNITVDLESNEIIIHDKKTENWKVTIIDTGLYSTVGQRIVAAKQYIGEEDFMVVYGDCLSNIDYNKLLRKHMFGQKTATVTLAHPTGRNRVIPVGEGGNLLKEAAGYFVDNHTWINACTAIFKNRIFEYLNQNRLYNMEFPLYEKLGEFDDIMLYCHQDFYIAMETKRDRITLEQLWESGNAPWKVWKEE